MNYKVIIEKGETSYGAYSPDLLGCVAVAETEEEVKVLIDRAIQIYLEELEKENLPIPKPSF